MCPRSALASPGRHRPELHQNGIPHFLFYLAGGQLGRAVPGSRGTSPGEPAGAVGALRKAPPRSGPSDANPRRGKGVKGQRWAPFVFAAACTLRPQALMAASGAHSRLSMQSLGPAGGLRAEPDHSAGLLSKVPHSGSTWSSLSCVRLINNYDSWPRVQHGERGDAPPSPPRDQAWRGWSSPRSRRRASLLHC